MELKELESATDGRKVTVAGIMTRVKILISKAGKQYSTPLLDDFTGTGELMIWSDLLEKRRPIIKEGIAVLVFGRTSVREGEKPKIMVDDFTLLEKATGEFPITVRIGIEGNPAKELNEALTKEFSSNIGESEIIIEYGSNDKRVQFKVTKFKVDPNPKFLKKLKSLAGVGSVKLVRVRNGR